MLYEVKKRGQSYSSSIMSASAPAQLIQYHQTSRSGSVHRVGRLLQQSEATWLQITTFYHAAGTHLQLHHECTLT